MIQSRQLGEIRVTRICEYYGPTHDPEILFPDFDPSVLRANESWMAPNHWHPVMNRLVITIQLWVIHAGSNIIVIDTGVGNHKKRATPRMNNLNTLVPTWLEAAGARPDKVTHVLMTHLHLDHIGWNTSLVGERWLPTFPNARYFMPKLDLEIISENHRKMPSDSFADSILPLLEEGLVDVVTGGELAGCLAVEDAAGHTPGQLNFRLRSGGEEAVFSGDIMHHPLQIVRPDWNTRYCELPDVALETRIAFLERQAESGALFMPMHFGPPHCGYIRRQGEGFMFEPATWPS